MPGVRKTERRKLYAVLGVQPEEKGRVKASFQTPDGQRRQGKHREAASNDLHIEDPGRARLLGGNHSEDLQHLLASDKGITKEEKKKS